MTYRLEGVFTAIADPSRRRMLDYLAETDMTAGELAERFAMSRPAVANHLRILEANGLVTVTPRGRERIHRLTPTPLLEIRDWLARYDRFWDDRLGVLKGLVESYDGEDD